MGNAKRIMGVFAVVLFSMPASAAEELQAGVVYEGGTTLQVSDIGVTFTIPAGWRGAWPAGSEVLLLQPVSDPNTYIVAMGQEASQSRMRETMGAPIDLGDGVSLKPRGNVSLRGAALAAHYDVLGTASALSGYGEALVGDHGVTVAYLLITSPDTMATFQSSVHDLIGSTSLSSPSRAAEQQSSGTDGGSGDRWDEYLKGKYIVRYYTTTGFTDEQHLWLCSDGRFARQGASGGFGGGASGAFQADSSGQWTASGAGEHGALTLQYGDGSIVQHELRWDYNENKLFVDGKRWLHGTNEVCN